MHRSEGSIQTADGAEDHGNDVGVGELARAEVDRDRDPAARPRGGSSRRSAHASRTVQAPSGTISPLSSATFRKAPGGSKSALGVLPAQRRLDPGESSRGERDLGLVEEPQLARSRPRCSSCSTVIASTARSRIPESNSSALAPLLLGPVHGGVGVLDQSRAVGATTPGSASATPMLALSRSSAPPARMGSESGC